MIGLSVSKNHVCAPQRKDQVFETVERFSDESG